MRVAIDGSGTSNVATGVSVLDHLRVLVDYASFDLALEIAPGDVEDEVREAGRAFGEALAEPLRAEGARGHGSAGSLAEALAHLALEASTEPLLVSNVDLSERPARRDGNRRRRCLPAKSSRPRPSRSTSA